MGWVRFAVVYTALALGANAAIAADPATLESLRVGDMEKLAFTEPVAVPDVPMIDATEAEHRLSDYRGKLLVVNFWATWCAPCREEMPSLDRLQAEMGDEDFAVLTVAAGRNPLPAIESFYAETGLENLPILRDPTQQLSRAMGVLGLPVTVIIDREGNEIGRLIGGAAWDGPEAKALLAALAG